MSQIDIHKAKGLSTYKNELILPEGSLVKANNTVINRDDIIESRRGLKVYNDIFPENGKAKQLLQYKGRLLVHYLDSLLFDDANGNFVAFNGSYPEMKEGLRIKGIETNGNYLFTTADGVKKISAKSPDELTTDSGYIRDAGVPKALDVQAEVDTSTLGFLQPVSSVAYRVLWGYKDNNDNLLLGSPSAISIARNREGERNLSGITPIDNTGKLEITLVNSYIVGDQIILYNTDYTETPMIVSTGTDATKIVTDRDYIAPTSPTGTFSDNAILFTYLSGNVDLTFTIPDGISDIGRQFYQIYRGPQRNNDFDASQPEDELNLVMEEFPSAAELAQGYVEITDITPDNFRENEALLYTNSISGDGILQSNENPPLAHDITKYKNITFYSNTKTKHQLLLNLLTVDTLVNDDYITIGDGTGADTTYTFKATENISNKEIKLYKAGSPAQNIDVTVRSLVKVINRNQGYVYAYYISGINDVPGQMLLMKRAAEDIEFYTKASTVTVGEAFNPILPIDNSKLSSNEEYSNRIYFSKESQAESVPSVNYFDVGSKDKKIERILGLRDSLLVFKADGVYRVTINGSNNFSVNLLDSSVPIIAPDSATILNNQVYMLSKQGVTMVSDSGANVLSREIEGDILTPTSHKYLNFDKYTFGVSYESERSYMLFLPTKVSDTVATQCYRYNTFTNAWTRWEVSKTCGIVTSNNDDRLYFGASDINNIEQERKDFNRTDYADREYERLLLNYSDEKIITLNTLDELAEDDVIEQRQIITMARFNRVLRSLDKDVYLDDIDYYSLLKLENGSKLDIGISNLIIKISADDVLGTYTPHNPSVIDVDGLKDEFNILMDEINTSLGVFRADYTQYNDEIYYEAAIDSINEANNFVTIKKQSAFLFGDLKLFKKIPVQIEWAPNFANAPSVMKQFQTAALMFDQFNFNEVQLTFRSDISDEYEYQNFPGEGSGDYGVQTFGEYTYGGGADQRQARTYIPRKKQRSRFILIGVLHNTARENILVTGYSLTFNSDTSTEKAYRS